MRANRWVLLVVGVVFCGLNAAEALASDARLDALAVQREYVEDYFNFRTFPTVAARYANLVTASLGTRSPGNDKSVGVIGAGDNTSYGVFALYLNQIQVNTNEQAQIDLTWAKQFSSMALGFGFLYQTSTAKGTLAPNSEVTPIGGPSLILSAPGTDVFSLTAGLKFEMATNSMLEVAAQAAWLSWSVDANGDGTNESEDAGNLSYKLSGRLMHEVSDKTTLVPLFQYAKIDLATKAVGGAPEDDNHATLLNLGVAMHHKVNGDDLLILGVSADHSSEKLDVGGAPAVDESNWSIPTLFAALEFDVYSWLTVRAGAHKTFDRSSDDVAQEDITDSSYLFGLGMGLHFDHFDVDATVNEDSVFTGGYLFSGEVSQPLTKVTGTYYF